MAHKPQKPRPKPNQGRGRPPGHPNTKAMGVGRLIRVMQEADKQGLVTQELRGFLLEVSRGKHLARHVGERIRATIWMLEQELGKAPQRVIVSDDRAEPFTGVDVNFIHGVDKHGEPVVDVAEEEESCDESSSSD